MHEIKDLLQVASRVRPAVVQRNSDPFSSDGFIRAFCASAGIQYQANNL
jgi:diketogulonate reductase-like aldo/keto reductase